MTPFDVIKQRLQLSKNHKGIYNCAKNIYKYEGYRSFYVSYPTTIMQSIPFQMIQFTAYEYACKVLNPSKEYNPTTHIISGGIAGGLASLITNPFDVVKTLLQTGPASTDPVLRNVKGLGDAIKVIFKKHGPAGFMRGANARLVANVPATAAAWTTYEFLKAVLT
jgi:solute carrier family 25 iron transporter 28/37